MPYGQKDNATLRLDSSNVSEDADVFARWASQGVSHDRALGFSARPHPIIQAMWEKPPHQASLPTSAMEGKAQRRQCTPGLKSRIPCAESTSHLRHASSSRAYSCQFAGAAFAT